MCVRLLASLDVEFLLGFFMDPSQQSYELERRSTRIRAQIPLHLRSLNPDVSCSEHCQTVVVNAQGCGVRTARPLDVGLEVALELPAGSSVNARVANSVPLGRDGKFWLVGLALDEPGNIWGIRPAPADWGAPKVFATANASNPTRKDQWPFAQFSSRGEFHPGRR